jgi:hypothetical protein
MSLCFKANFLACISPSIIVCCKKNFLTERTNCKYQVKLKLILITEAQKCLKYNFFRPFLIILIAKVR